MHCATGRNRRNTFKKLLIIRTEGREQICICSAAVSDPPHLPGYNVNKPHGCVGTGVHLDVAVWSTNYPMYTTMHTRGLLENIKNKMKILPGHQQRSVLQLPKA